MFAIGFLIFIGLCIYHACEKEIPSGYYRNSKLMEKDLHQLRCGKISQREFDKNVERGKYR